MRRLVELITLSRFFLTAASVAFAVLDSKIFFAFFAILAALTDAADGFLARRFNVQSEKGARTDSYADMFLIAGLLFSMIIIRPEVFFSFVPFWIAGILLFFALLVIRKIRNDHFGGLHLVSAKSAVLLGYIGVIYTAVAGLHNSVFFIVWTVYVIGMLDEISIYLLYKNPRKVRSVFGGAK